MTNKTQSILIPIICIPIICIHNYSGPGILSYRGTAGTVILLDLQATLWTSGLFTFNFLPL